MSEQLALLPGYLTAHLQLTLIALLAGVGFSVPLGIFVTRVRWLEQPVMSVASVVQTIPGLALLAIMVPLLAAVQLPSIGFLPAIIGLVLYSVLPILRNTIVGIDGVDPALVAAARGVGMTPRQQLRLVELPLALPVIVAGIRTATVWTVGVATLSTPVGATSLGNYIFSGLQTRNFSAVLLGCVAASLLALFLDGLIRLGQLALDRRRRGWSIGVLAVVGGLYIFVALSFAASMVPTGEVRPVKIGSKAFTEQYILAEILADQIDRKAGRSTEVVQSLGSTVAFDALREGGIDVYVDYSGTIWATVLEREGRHPGREAVLEEVRRVLQTDYGIVLVAALGFENAYALAMRREHAERAGIRSIGDLVARANGLTIGADYEFFSRQEWKSLREVYGLRFGARRIMDPALMYQAVARGNVDVITAFSTDGRIAAFDLVLLEDDRAAIPPYDAIVLVSDALLRDAPRVVETLRGLEGSIDAASMRAMNLAVDRDGRAPADVARSHLLR